MLQLAVKRDPMTGPGMLGVVLVLALALAGCSADSALFRADWTWWSGSREPPPLSFAAASAQGLIGPDGNCAGDSSQSPGAIWLGMTECDLIRLAGPTDKIEIGANERGQRTAVITYPQGERAGIYRFTSGLLVSVERVAEPLAPRKPARPSSRNRTPS